MLISAIPVGGPISIEISIDNVSYEMPSSVVASKNGYILIAPFTSKGAVIDFSSYKDILFNLYTIDPVSYTHLDVYKRQEEGYPLLHWQYHTTMQYILHFFP